MKLINKFYFFLHGIWIFAKRDLTTRYAGSVLGIIWIILYPLAMAVITSIVFAIAFQKTIEQVPFFLYTLAGFSAWVFFVQSVTSSTRSLVQNRDIIINNKIPTELILGGIILSRCIDLVITTTFLVLMSVFMGVLTFNPILFLISVLTLILATGIISFISAAGNVYFRDVQALVDIFLNIIFYATPIIYPLSVIPAHFLWIFKLNPLTPMFLGFRASILNVSYDSVLLTWAFAVFFVLFLGVVIIYKHLEKRFAQLL